MNTSSNLPRIVTILILLLGCQLQARDIEEWTYKNMERAADLIVIGPAEKSEDSGELVPGPLWKVDFVGVNTTIKVNGTLKGKTSDSQVTVFHLRLPEGQTLENSPKFLGFRTGILQIKSPGKITSLARPEYLLFLKKRKDGRYEPVSGPLEAAYSAREVYLPLNPR